MTEDQHDAQRRAEDAIRFAPMALRMLTSLALDMQAAGVLRPRTKSDLLDMLREALEYPDRGAAAPDPDQTRRALEVAQRLLRDPAPLERELKRERPSER